MKKPFDITKKHKQKLWLPPTDLPAKDINSDSWFHIKEFKNVTANNKLKNRKLAKKSNIRCKQVTLYPNDKQKKILLNWMEIYRYVYNLTVKYFRTHKVCKFEIVRTIIMKQL
jgi:hypothetical protein